MISDFFRFFTTPSKYWRNLQLHAFCTWNFFTTWERICTRWRKSPQKSPQCNISSIQAVLNEIFPLKKFHTLFGLFSFHLGLLYMYVLHNILFIVYVSNKMETKNVCIYHWLKDWLIFWVSNWNFQSIVLLIKKSFFSVSIDFGQQWVNLLISCYLLLSLRVNSESTRQYRSKSARNIQIGQFSQSLCGFEINICTNRWSFDVSNVHCWLFCVCVCLFRAVYIFEQSFVRKKCYFFNNNKIVFRSRTSSTPKRYSTNRIMKSLHTYLNSYEIYFHYSHFVENWESKLCSVEESSLLWWGIYSSFVNHTNASIHK